MNPTKNFPIVCYLIFGGIAGWFSMIDQASATDRIYVVNPDGADTGDGPFGQLLALDGLPVGNSGLGQAGDTTFLDVQTDVADLRTIDTGDNGEVLVGGIRLQIYDSDLGLVHDGNPLNEDGNAATAVEIGGLGPGTFVVATHDLPQFGATCGAGSGGGCSQLLAFDNSLAILGANPLPNAGSAQGIEFGELFALAPGPEVAVGSSFADYPNGTAGTAGFIYMFGFNGTNFQFVNQHALNATSSDLAIGDVFGGTSEDIVITGATPQSSHTPPVPQGQGTMAFSDGATTIFEWENALAAPAGDPPAGKTMRAIVIADVVVGAADPDGGNEIIVAGNNVLRILNNLDPTPDGNDANEGVIQEIPLNDDVIDIAIGDVLRNDGVDEIVVITASGLIIALEHTNPLDLSSPFAADPGNGIGAAFTTGRDLRGIEILSDVISTDNADFDGDLDVDGADFLIWQRGLDVGLIQSEGDADGDNDVDADDLAVWEMQYGNPPPLGAALDAVPEPTSLALLVIVGLAGLGSRRLLQSSF